MDFGTIAHALHDAQQRLVGSSPTPQLDARILLAHILGFDQAQLLAQRYAHLDHVKAERLNALLERRAQGEPIAYLIGYREFFGLRFAVDRRVLVPRPETELLVELALAWLKHHHVAQPIIADIGTGSGCIAVSLAHQIPHAHVYAIDLSTDALAVARQNAQLHDVYPQISFLHGNGVEPLVQPANLIVSNPPYTVLAEVDAGVYAFEPHLALDGGSEGLDMYRWLIPACHNALDHTAPNALMLEIGAWQGSAVCDLARQTFPHAQIDLHRDLAGHDRVVTIRLNETIKNDDA